MAQPGPAPGARSTARPLAASRLAFFCLAGFVAAQAYQVPLVTLPLNWAVWPGLPDLFAAGLVLTVVLSQPRPALPPFHRDTLRDLVWIGLVLAVNFVLITIPSSETQEGIKYGGFALILWAKYVAICWAAAHVPLDERRRRALHVVALLALLFVSLTMLADRLYLIEIDSFARHLPRLRAGKWGAVGLSSTVGASDGATTVTILILSGLVLGTARHRFTWLVEAVVFALGIGTCFLSGSRQGLVRMVAFITTYSLRKPAKYLLPLILFLVPATVIFMQNNSLRLRENLEYLRALERQGVLLSDPFSNEGLAGRPELWQEIVDKLNEEPVRWAIGYGIGNYVEYEAASHNMMLRLIQDGGLVELVLVGFLWIRILRRVWAARHRAWASVALTAGMLTSAFTSEIFYPTLSTGWYLGLYVITLQLLCREAEDSNDKN